jgi:hypothetical protein
VETFFGPKRDILADILGKKVKIKVAGQDLYLGYDIAELRDPKKSIFIITDSQKDKCEWIIEKHGDRYKIKTAMKTKYSYEGKNFEDYYYLNVFSITQIALWNNTSRDDQLWNITEPNADNTYIIRPKNHENKHFTGIVVRDTDKNVSLGRSTKENRDRWEINVVY